MLFVEVKYRENSDGLCAITPKKLKQMQFAADFYCQERHVVNLNPKLAVASVTGKNYTVKDFLILE
ncbi:YraN family protein [Candidatus Saccharibacteria bacterium]|nr:YraN family protein [Candidatus Saccharibacteria bacterium]